MKLIKKTGALVLFAAIMSISFSGCDFNGLSDAVDDFKVVIGLEPINTTSTVLIEDANTGELIDGIVHVEFEGENGDDVIDIYSDPLPEEEVEGGVLNFGVDNSVTPNESSPVRVQLVAEANGYVTTAKTVVIEKEGASEFRLRMVRENDKPEGVSSSTNNEGSTDTEGTVQEDYSAGADAESSTDAGASVDVTSGTRFKDASGTNLTGQLTTEVSYYNPSEVSAMSSVPVDLVDEEGNPIIVAGASQVSVTDQNGRRAATAEVTAKSKLADGPLSYTFKIPSSVINPLAGRPYNEGDNAIIFIFDTSFNVTIENGTVEALEAGGLGVRYNSSVVPLISVTGNPLLASAASCGANFAVNRNGNNGALSGRVFTSGFVTEFRIPQGISQYTIPQAPNVEMTIEIETPAGAIVSQTVNICQQGGLTIDLPAPPSNLIDATMEATLQCKNPDEVVSVTDLPGASVVYRKVNAASGTDWRVASDLQWNFDEENNALTGGSFSIEDVEQGGEYTFKISFDGNNYQRNVVITGETVTYQEVIDEDICG